MVIYCHSTILLSFCVIEQNYCGNYLRIAVNFHGKKVLCHWSMVENISTVVIYCDILTLEKVGLKLHGKLLRYHFITSVTDISKKDFKR